MPELIDDPVWMAWLTKEHDEVTIKSWSNSLRMFRFCRADRGSGTNGDKLVLTFGFHNSDQYNLLACTFATDMPPFALTSSPSNIYNDDTLLRGMALWQKWTTVADMPAHLLISGWTCSISVQSTKNIWIVDQQSVDRACAMEERLKILSPLVMDPPRESASCVCPKFYPLWFAGE
jgi:hypothetical protein